MEPRPDDPATRTDFDSEHPVELTCFAGHTVRVYRSAGCPTSGRGREPQIVMVFDGTPYVLRPARSYDSRETIGEAALPLARCLAEPDT